MSRPRSQDDGCRGRPARLVRRPSIEWLGNFGSGAGIESPCRTNPSGSWATRRCRKNWPLRNASTISPGRTFSAAQTEISTASWGQRVGSMLSPRTSIRKRPLTRSASAAKAERSACAVSSEVFTDNQALRSLARSDARTLHGEDLSTGQRRRLENALIAECRLLIRSFFFRGITWQLLSMVVDAVIPHSGQTPARRSIAR
jgi:hypothetical protein